MGKKSAKTPPPPNPVETSQASTSTNVGTAVTNAMMNNPNLVSPGGTTTWSTTGAYDWHDPYTGQTYSIPMRTGTVQLSPTGQQAYDATEAAQRNLATLAAGQSAFLNPYMSSGVDMSAGAISGRGVDALNLDLGGTMGRVDTSAGAIEDQLGRDGFTYANLPDVNRLRLGNEATEARLFELGRSRLDPMFNRDEERMRQQMANQGISADSDAYSRAVGDFGKRRNDAYNQLLLTGRAQAANEAATEWNSDVTRRQMFANEQMGARQQQMAERGQAFGEITGGAGTELARRGQLTNEQLASYNADMGSRQQALNEILTMRNQPLNEIGALMSGGQVNMPLYGGYAPSPIPTTDVAGIINTNYMQQLQAAQIDQQNSNSLTGGLMGLGSSALGALGMAAMGGAFGSDRRIKHNIRKVGTADNGLPIYAFSYKGDITGATWLGFMADEVEQVHPDAVAETPDGFKMVNYDKAIL